jgi:coenzyme F420-reducing hydrogenase delta subunit/ferredoxin
MEETLVEPEDRAEGAAERKDDVRILAFLCNWCSYAGADLAGVSRLQYPPNVVDIRVMCTGTISPYFVLKALQEGIDGVLIAGCHIGDCHYDKGNYATAKRFRVIKDLLVSMGMDPQRIRLEWVSAAEGAKFQDVITSFTEQVRAAGKSPLGKAEKRPAAASEGAEPLQIEVGEWTAGATEEAVAKSVRGALESGDASAAVVLTVCDGVIVPRIVRKADDPAIDELYAGDVRYPMTSFALMVLPLVPGRLALPVRECDRRMIVELKKHNQIDPDRLLLLGVPCSQDVANACGCDHPATPEDIAVMSALAVAAEPCAPEGALAEEAGGRFDFWMDSFSRCLKCMGCRNVCPMCYCADCALDNPDIVGPDSKPPDIPIFHLIRAIDMADRCIDCGMCEAICPAEIPLRQLYRQARQVVKDAFGYEPGINPDDTSPVKMLGSPTELGGMEAGSRAT